MAHTRAASDNPGMLQDLEHPERTIVDFWRACTCGSTMMVISDERRSNSFQGAKTRELMGVALDQLMGDGLCYEEAKTQLMSWIDAKIPAIPESHHHLMPYVNRLRILLNRTSPAATHC